jgi:hypothetical protein
VNHHRNLLHTRSCRSTRTAQATRRWVRLMEGVGPGSLEGEQVTAQLFKSLWMHDSIGRAAEGVIVPDTVIIQERCPVAWYFTGADGVIKQKRHRNLSVKRIVEAFLSPASSPGAVPPRTCGIVAEVVARNDDGECVALYLDEDGFQRFMLSRLPKHAVVQRFVEPRGGRNHTIRVMWTSKITMAERRTNRRALVRPEDRGEIDWYERAVTYDGEPHNTVIEPLSGKMLSRLVQELSETVVFHVAQVTHLSVRIAQMVLDCKIGADDRLWLIRAASLRLEGPKPDVLKASTVTGGDAPSGKGQGRKPQQVNSLSDANNVGLAPALPVTGPIRLTRDADPSVPAVRLRSVSGGVRPLTAPGLQLRGAGPTVRSTPALPDADTIAQTLDREQLDSLFSEPKWLRASVATTGVAPKHLRWHKWASTHEKTDGAHPTVDDISTVVSKVDPTSVKQDVISQATDPASGLLVNRRHLESVPTTALATQTLEAAARGEYTVLQSNQCPSCGSTVTDATLTHTVTYKTVMEHYVALLSELRLLPDPHDCAGWSLEKTVRVVAQSAEQGQEAAASRRELLGGASRAAEPGSSWRLGESGHLSSRAMSVAGGIGLFGVSFLGSMGVGPALEESELLEEEKRDVEHKRSVLVKLVPTVPPTLRLVHPQLSATEFASLSASPLFQFKTTSVCEGCYLVYSKFGSNLLAGQSGSEALAAVMGPSARKAWVSRIRVKQRGNVSRTTKAVAASRRRSSPDTVTGRPERIDAHTEMVLRARDTSMAGPMVPRHNDPVTRSLGQSLGSRPATTRAASRTAPTISNDPGAYTNVSKTMGGAFGAQWGERKTSPQRENKWVEDAMGLASEWVDLLQDTKQSESVMRWGELPASPSLDAGILSMAASRPLSVLAASRPATAHAQEGHPLRYLESMSEAEPPDTAEATLQQLSALSNRPKWWGAFGPGSRENTRAVLHDMEARPPTQAGGLSPYDTRPRTSGSMQRASLAPTVPQEVVVERPEEDAFVLREPTPASPLRPRGMAPPSTINIVLESAANVLQSKLQDEFETASTMFEQSRLDPAAAARAQEQLKLREKEKAIQKVDGWIRKERTARKQEAASLKAAAGPLPGDDGYEEALAAGTIELVYENEEDEVIAGDGMGGATEEMRSCEPQALHNRFADRKAAVERQKAIDEAVIPESVIQSMLLSQSATKLLRLMMPGANVGENSVLDAADMREITLSQLQGPKEDEIDTPRLDQPSVQLQESPNIGYKHRDPTRKILTVDERETKRKLAVMRIEQRREQKKFQNKLLSEIKATEPKDKSNADVVAGQRADDLVEAMSKLERSIVGFRPPIAVPGKTSGFIAVGIRRKTTGEDGVAGRERLELRGYPLASLPTLDQVQLAAASKNPFVAKDGRDATADATSAQEAASAKHDAIMEMLHKARQHPSLLILRRGIPGEYVPTKEDEDRVMMARWRLKQGGKVHRWELNLLAKEAFVLESRDLVHGACTKVFLTEAEIMQAYQDPEAVSLLKKIAKNREKSGDTSKLEGMANAIDGKYSGDRFLHAAVRRLKEWQQLPPRLLQLTVPLEEEDKKVTAKVSGNKSDDLRVLQQAAAMSEDEVMARPVGEVVGGEAGDDDADAFAVVMNDSLPRSWKPASLLGSAIIPASDGSFAWVVVHAEQAALSMENGRIQKHQIATFDLFIRRFATDDGCKVYPKVPLAKATRILQQLSTVMGHHEADMEAPFPSNAFERGGILRPQGWTTDPALRQNILSPMRLFAARAAVCGKPLEPYSPISRPRYAAIALMFSAARADTKDSPHDARRLKLGKHPISVGRGGSGPFSPRGTVASKVILMRGTDMIRLSLKVDCAPNPLVRLTSHSLSSGERWEYPLSWDDLSRPDVNPFIQRAALELLPAIEEDYGLVRHHHTPDSAKIVPGAVVPARRTQETQLFSDKGRLLVCSIVSTLPTADFRTLDGRGLGYLVVVRMLLSEPDAVEPRPSASLAVKNQSDDPSSFTFSDAALPRFRVLVSRITPGSRQASGFSSMGGAVKVPPSRCPLRRCVDFPASFKPPVPAASSLPQGYWPETESSFPFSSAGDDLLAMARETVRVANLGSDEWVPGQMVKGFDMDSAWRTFAYSRINDQRLNVALEHVETNRFRPPSERANSMNREGMRRVEQMKREMGHTD